MQKQNLSQKRLKHLLNYNPTSGEFVWINKTSNLSRIDIGSIAGTINPNGRRYIIIDGTKYFSSRLAWFYVTGMWPINQIDHINRIRNDDRFCNLREATIYEQAHNRGIKGDAITGIQGVSITKSNTYQARIIRFGEVIFQKTFKTLEEAEYEIENARLKFEL
jgi:HNH endonuclease